VVVWLTVVPPRTPETETKPQAKTRRPEWNTRGSLAEKDWQDVPHFVARVGHRELIKGVQPVSVAAMFCHGGELSTNESE
jgi:hypothetical protein